MPRNEDKNEKGNIFDRIFRENVQHIFIPLIEMELGLKFKSYKVLQEKIAKTLEREVDFLCEVLTETNEKELLHIEFQTQNDSEMVFRMLEYHGLLYRKYKLPIHHIVVYLGTSKSRMISKLPREGVFKGFHLIKLNEIDKDKFLTAQVPEIIILALLSDFKKEKLESVLRLILNKLKKVPKNKAGRYINQLILLSKLRNLEKKTIKIIEDMPILIDINDSVLFQRGVEKGKIEGKIEGKDEEIQKAVIGIHKKGIPLETIAEALEISLERVDQIIEDWKSNLEKQ